MKITGTIHNYQMDVLISDLNLIQDLLKSCTLNGNKTLDDLRIDRLLEIISDKMETYDSNNILPYHITDIGEYDDEYYDDYDPIQDTCFKLWVFFYSIIPRPRFYSDKNEAERLSILSYTSTRLQTLEMPLRISRKMYINTPFNTKMKSFVMLFLQSMKLLKKCIPNGVNLKILINTDTKFQI